MSRAPKWQPYIDELLEQFEAELLEDEGDTEAHRCEACGSIEFVDVFEVWREDRAWQLWTCCEYSRDQWLTEMSRYWSRHDWQRFFWLRTGLELRDVVDREPGIDGYCLDFGITVGEVTLQQAKDFVRQHHRHNRPPCGWRFGFGAYNGTELVAVAMVGRPVARMLDHERVVEVNRLCVNHELPAGVVWNACSMLYAAAAQEARRRGFERIITYTLETEDGVALRASGWLEDGMTKGGTWNRPSRARADRAPTCRKRRWARELVKRRRAA